MLDWFVDYLKDFDNPDFRHLRRYIITNGSLLDEKTICTLTDGERPVHFLVSMDGVTMETYNKVRKNLEFKKVLSVLRILSDVQNKRVTENIVRWNYVVMKSTLKDMRQAVDLAGELQIDLNFAPIQGMFRDENIFLAPEISGIDLFEHFNKLEEYTLNNNIHVSGFAGMKYRLENALVERS